MVRFWALFSVVPNGVLPKPREPGPLAHAASLKAVARHAVPWSTPVSRYFQVEP